MTDPAHPTRTFRPGSEPGPGGPDHRPRGTSPQPGPAETGDGGGTGAAGGSGP